MLRTKDVITKLLDGLEMFLGVFETCRNSSNSKMAGGWHIYRPPSEESCWEPLPNFLRGVGYTDGVAPVHPVTLCPGVAIGASDT